MKLTDLKSESCGGTAGLSAEAREFFLDGNRAGDSKKQKAVRIRVFENKEIILTAGSDEKADNRGLSGRAFLKAENPLHLERGGDGRQWRDRRGRKLV